MKIILAITEIFCTQLSDQSHLQTNPHLSTHSIASIYLQLTEKTIKMRCMIIIEIFQNIKRQPLSPITFVSKQFVRDSHPTIINHKNLSQYYFLYQENSDYISTDSYPFSQYTRVSNR